MQGTLRDVVWFRGDIATCYRFNNFPRIKQPGVPDAGPDSIKLADRQAQSTHRSPLTLSAKLTMRFFSSAIIVLSALIATSLAVPVSVPSVPHIHTVCSPPFPQLQQRDLVKREDLLERGPPGQAW